MLKVIVFFGHFFGNFGLMFKKHCKIGISAHLKKKKEQKIGKKQAILMVNNWATLMVNNWATFVPHKNRQRGPVINH